MKKGFIRGEVLPLTPLLRKKNFENRLIERGYLAAIVRKYLSEVKSLTGKQLLNRETNPPVKKLLPFVTQYYPAYS